MDRSITTGCFSTSNAISKTSLALPAFVREVRESRSEMDTISGELHSLDGVLDLMKDDAASMPPELARLAPDVLRHCTTIVNELDGYLSTLNGNGLSRTDKKFRWIATRDHMEKLRMTLEGYKSTLGLALDLVALYGLQSPTPIVALADNRVFLIAGPAYPARRTRRRIWREWDRRSRT